MFIDTLLMKISADSSDYDEKMKKAKKETDDLDESTDKLQSTIKRATTEGVIFGNILSKVFDVVAKVAIKAVNSYQDYAEKLRIISRETSQSIEDFQKWSYAIEYTGGSISSFTSTFEKLSKQVRQAPFTHNSTFLRGLNELGVNVHEANGKIKSMSDLLLGLAGRLGGMSEGKALLIGQRLGLDDDTIRLLMKGKNAVQEYLDKTKEDEVISKRNVELYDRLRKLRVEISKSWKELTISIGNFFLPIMIKVSEWYLKFQNIIKENMPFLRHTGQLILNIVKGLLIGAVAFGLITNAVKLFKLALWGLGIGALILIWDDFMTYLEGGESVIGKVIEAFKSLGSYLKDVFVGVVQFVKDFWSGFVDFFASKIEWVLNKIDFFKGKLKGIFGFGGEDEINANIKYMSTPMSNQNVSNTTQSWDFRGSTIMTKAINGQTLMSDLPQQTLINNSGGYSY